MPKMLPDPDAFDSILDQLTARLIIFADEDPVMYDGLRGALLHELAPRSPYERMLVENLVNLEWEAQRHRRMRDELIRAKARDLAVGLYETGQVKEYFTPTAEHLALGSDLVSSSPGRAKVVNDASGNYEVTIGEIFAKAYSSMADHVERHERKLAETETRRRRLREEYDRLRATPRRPIDDAEIIK